MKKEDLSWKNRIEGAINQIQRVNSQKFIPGQTFIPTGLAIYDENEISAIVESMASEKLGLSLKGREFEEKFANYCEVDFSILTNSGSSSSLLALAGIKEKYKLNKGEIITTACGFPTTINPIIQLGFDPVFIDVDNTYNANPEIIKKAIGPNTKGLFFAHTLGNPAPIQEIVDLANKNNLFVIEDCCDAYGALYDGKKCGSFGNASTASFYPAHNITLAGEGGAIMTKDCELNKIIKSLRDWGRDCHCDAGQDNACEKRFEHSLNGTPYDHKYIFTRIGYNLKPIEAQAAMGLEQLKKIEFFNEKRRENFNKLENIFSKYEDFFEFPEINPKADPVFFGFPLMIKNKKLDRKNLVNFLNENKIGTRYLFGGNLLHQPAYKDKGYKVVGDLQKSNEIFENLFWIGIHPGITDEIINYIDSKFKEYLE